MMTAARLAALECCFRMASRVPANDVKRPRRPASDRRAAVAAGCYGDG